MEKKVRKDLHKRKYYLLVGILLLITIVSFTGFFSNTWNKITGMGTASGTTGLSVVIGNAAPTIYFVEKVSPANPSSIESSVTQVNFTFLANDTDGAVTLDNSDARMSVHFNDSEGERFNGSCTYENDVTGDSGSRNYSCTIYMEFFDVADNWVINASIDDTNNVWAQNNTTTFAYGSTLAIDTGPSSMAWTSFGVTAADQKSSNNPFQVNNTANSDITTINITAIDLEGNETAGEYIYAGNFSINTANACNSGNILSNKTNGTAECGSDCAFQIPDATVKHGNNSKQDLYLCIEAVNADLSSQAYNATGGDAWTIIAIE